MAIRPKPEGWLSPYDYGHSDEKVTTVIDLLDDWLLAIESGEARYRLPDPNHKRRNGKPPWTDAELETAIAAIDAKVDRELSWAKTNKLMMCTAGPGFIRLPVEQRRAMAQQMDLLLAKFDNGTGG